MLLRHATVFIPAKEVFFVIVDLHTHIFPDKVAHIAIPKLRDSSHTHPFTDGTAAGLRKAMDAVGVDLSVVLPVATNPQQVARVNDSSARMNRGGNGVISFGAIHPDCADWKEELDRIAALGLKGIKIHPIYQGVDMDDVRYVRILARAGELGLAVVVHAGRDIGFPGEEKCTPAMLRRAVQAAGPVKLIAAHMGGWRNWDVVGECLADTTVGLDTSYALGRVAQEGEGHFAPEELELMSQEQFVGLVRQFGADRIYFGTDSPWRGHEESLAELRALPLTETEKAMILGENACRLLALDGWEENT